MLAGWNEIGDCPLNRVRLKNRYYLPNVVLVSGQDGRGIEQWDLEMGGWSAARGCGWTHWAPIPVPPKREAAEPAAKPCTCAPPVVNITFGDVNIANESDADEFQARVIEAVRKALGEEDKGQAAEVAGHVHQHNHDSVAGTSMHTHKEQPVPWAAGRIDCEDCISWHSIEKRCLLDENVCHYS